MPMRRPVLQVSGKICYNGEGFDSFYPERTAAYVDQVSSPPCTAPLSSHLLPLCLSLVYI